MRNVRCCSIGISHDTRMKLLFLLTIFILPPLSSAFAADLAVIVMEVTGSCFDCQNYKLEFYDDGQVVFNGNAYTKQPGRSVASISSRHLTEIKRGFYDIEFFGLAPEYTQPRNVPSDTRTDVTTRLTFRDRNIEHSVLVNMGYGTKRPPGFTLLTDLIKRLSGAKQWACPVISSRGFDICTFPD